MSGLKVLSVASEVFPLVKTGGLADVAGALPGALVREDVEMRTLTPAYPAVKDKLGEAKVAREYADLFGAPARLLVGRAAGLDLFAIDAPHLFDRPGNPYLGPDGTDWPDNARRFAALARVGADIGLGAVAAFQPHVVHAHDWQAGLAAAYLRYSGRQGPGSIITVHNLAFQGHFPVSVFWELGLPDEALTLSGVEYYGGVGYLKAGLQLSDIVTTVSPTYAREIQTPEFGMALDGLLRARGEAVHGILNGIDDEVWNPSTDPALAQTYNPLRIDMRGRNKAALQSRLGLEIGADRPLFAVVSRLSHQKGLDLLLHALPRIVDRGGQFALLGSGERWLEFGLFGRRREPSRFGRLRLRLRREARPSLPVGGGFHPGAVALRALRADAAVRLALWRDADRLARRRARRHGRSTQTTRLWRRASPPACSSPRRRSRRSATQSAGRSKSIGTRRPCAGCD